MSPTDRHELRRGPTYPTITSLLRHCKSLSSLTDAASLPSLPSKLRHLFRKEALSSLFRLSPPGEMLRVASSSSSICSNFMAQRARYANKHQEVRPRSEVPSGHSSGDNCAYPVYGNGLVGLARSHTYIQSVYTRTRVCIGVENDSYV